MGKNEIKGDLTIEDLYPELSPDELAKAEFNLHGYLDVVKRIWERLETESRLEGLISEIQKERRKKR